MLSFVRSSFIQGVVLALAFLAPIPTSQSRPSLDPEPCDVPTWPVEMQSFIDLSCQLHAAAGLEGQPTTIYSVNKHIESPGTYVVTPIGPALHTATLTVIAATKLDLRDLGSTAPAASFDASVVVGTMEGFGGSSAPLLMLSYKRYVPGAASHTGLVPVKLLSAAEFDTYAHDARLLAGPRLVDSLTGKSYRTGDPLPGSIASAMVHTSDPSTMYCSFQNSLEPGIDLPCIIQAYKSNANDRDLHEKEMKLCVTRAFVEFAILVVICGAEALIPPPFGQIAFAICMIGAAAKLALDIADCMAVYHAKLAHAQNQLRIDLEACGVLIYEI